MTAFCIVLAFCGGALCGAIFRIGRDAEKAYPAFVKRLRDQTMAGSFSGPTLDHEAVKS